MDPMQGGAATLAGDWATHIVVGGGTAGCVVAARLSEVPSNRVLLLEAGQDFTPAETPLVLKDTYAALALSSPEYFWTNIKVSRGSGDQIPPRARKPFHYFQGKVIGGGSAINGQVALRGAPDDYDAWAAMGATGWDSASVLPYFRKLERDLNFQNEYHGDNGPIAIRRVPRQDWDPFTQAVARDWEAQGHRYVEDMNGAFAEGYSAIPLSNDGRERMSTAIAYLNNEARRRPNLRIQGGATVERVRTDGTRATGVDYTVGGQRHHASAAQIVLSAGALNTPKILMLSGIGPADHLRSLGISVAADRPGVGANLQDHPLISVSAYLPAFARSRPTIRRNYSYLRYSSGLAGCERADMLTMAICRSSWHAIGERIATLSAYVALPYSHGSFRLASPDPAAEAKISFEWLSDPRDHARMLTAFANMSRMLMQGRSAEQCRDPFPSAFSARVAAISRPTLWNRIAVGIGAMALDGPAALRRFLMNNVISEAPALDRLMADAAAMNDYVCANIRSAWHAAGSCRMGAADDPASVVDPLGRVIGIGGLWVADASIMPQISRNNTNLPTIMIGEHVADLIRRHA